MTASEILAILKRLIDVWVDLVVGGRADLAKPIWMVIDDLFKLYRNTLMAERAAVEGLPWPLPVEATGVATV